MNQFFIIHQLLSVHYFFTYFLYLFYFKNTLLFIHRVDLLQLLQ